ncbi:MAG: alpha/beta hydrolase-fold protein [Chloroflexi bacterium]|nr:alpha/beta hydrolase-fold protein [Chloroflexota bacterium]
MCATSACLPRLPASKRAVLATHAPTLTPSPFIPPDQLAAPGEATLIPVPLSTQAAGGDCREAPGRMVNDTAPSSLGGPALIWIAYLPPCYKSEPDVHYPLLILLHAAERNLQQWLSLGIPETADRMIASGALPPLIIVMPNSPLDNASDAFILADLLPALDARYPLNESRGQRAIGGLSLGAAQALRVEMQRPDLFGALGLHSLTPVEADQARLAGWLTAMPAGLMPRVYVDIGDKDVQRDAVQAIAQQLSASGVEVTWQLNSGAHADSYWRTHLAEYLSWYASGWR